MPSRRSPPNTDGALSENVPLVAPAAAAAADHEAATTYDDWYEHHHAENDDDEVLSQAYSEAPASGDVLELRAALLVGAGTFGMWALFMQLHSLKAKIGIESADGMMLARFTLSTSIGYVGKVLAIMTHSIFLSCWQPRERAIFGMCGMAMAHLMILVCFYMGSEPMTTSLVVVALAYFIGGYARGVMESNVYTFLAPYGPKAKQWAAVGFTLGWTISGVVIFSIYHFASGWDDTMHRVVFGVVVFVNLSAAVTAKYFIGPPEDDTVVPQENFYKFLHDLNEWREWVPTIRFNVVSYCVVGFCSTLTNGVIQLMYLGPDGAELVPGVVVSGDIFMVLYCALSFFTGNLGAMKGRYLPHFEYFTAITGLLGMFAAMSGVPLLGLVGGCMQFFALSSSIATTVAIDTHVARRFNLSAVSLWLLLYNFGMLVGLAVAGPVRSILGSPTS